jgi:hypothetical protein
MTRKMKERLEKNRESVKAAIFEAARAGCLKGGVPHVPLTAWRRMAPNKGFNAHRCS